MNTQNVVHAQPHFSFIFNFYQASELELAKPHSWAPAPFYVGFWVLN